MRLVYVAGLGRSGSTLLSQLLGQLDAFSSVGEVHHLWRTGAPRRSTEELCGCGRTFRDCPFWTRVLDEGGIEEIPADRVQALQRQVARIRFLPWMLGPWRPGRYGRRLSEVQAIVDRLYGALERAAGGSRIVDATKDLAPLYLLSTMPGYQVDVVHLVRDPRGVAHSWAKLKRRPEYVDREVYMHRYGGASIALRWLYSNWLAERARGRHRGYLRLRYEDLVREPGVWLERICELADLPRPDLSFLGSGQVELRRPSHIMSGNPSRFATGRIAVRLDQDWQRAMPPGRRRLVSALTLPLRARYGYAGAGEGG
jgi:hypothetical protein